jgi:hypothetical protein
MSALGIMVKDHIQSIADDLVYKMKDELNKSAEKYIKYQTAKENGENVEADYFTLNDVENIINVSIETFNSGLSNAIENIVNEWRSKYEEDTVPESKKRYSQYNVTLKNQAKRSLEISVTNLKFLYNRTMYRATDVEGRKILSDKFKTKAFYFFDDMFLGKNLPFKLSKKMMLNVAQRGQLCNSFEDAASSINKTYNLDMSPSYVRTVSNFVGWLQFNAETEEAERLYLEFTNYKINANHLSNIVKPERKYTGKILYAMIDGASIYVQLGKDTPKKYKRENKLAMMYLGNQIVYKDGFKLKAHQEIEKRKYASFIGGKEQFKKYVLSLSKNYDKDSYDLIVVISDGATWIRTLCDEIFSDKPKCTILDYFHVTDKAKEWAKSMITDEEPAAWVKRFEKILLEGDGNDIMQMLEPYKGITREKVPDLYSYVQKNIDRMKYKLYMAKGLHIGSGQIESGNKKVMIQRCRQSGMIWRTETAQNILTLRSKWLNGDWKDVESLILNTDFANVIRQAEFLLVINKKRNENFYNRKRGSSSEEEIPPTIPETVEYYNELIDSCTTFSKKTVKNIRNIKKRKLPTNDSKNKKEELALNNIGEPISIDGKDDD